MSDFKNGIKFCFSENEHIAFRDPRKFLRKHGRLIEKVAGKDAEIKLELVWTLYKFEGEKEIDEYGQFKMPIHDLGNGLHDEWIALCLNDTDCFDFEYIPSEGDNLKIHENVILSPYLSFVYRNNEWIIDYHNPWSTEISKLKEGKVKAL